MSQTWENGEKLNIGPDFGSFGPYLGTTIGCKLLFYAVSRKTNDPNDPIYAR